MSYRIKEGTKSNYQKHLQLNVNSILAFKTKHVNFS